MTDVLLLESLPEYLRQVVEAGTPGKYLCPKCDGGRSKEMSLSVYGSGEGIVKLRCWRASCGWFGLTMTDPTAELHRKHIKPPSVYREPTQPITGRNLGPMLTRRYGLQRDLIDGHGWATDQDARTLVMPIRCPYGGERGHVTRSFETNKRCYTYKATAQPWLDWWAGGKTIVIVEDCLSACRLAGLGYTAVALLGTGITVAQAQEIAAYAGQGRSVWLALDRDAFGKALKLASRHKHIVPLMPICLDEDIKNMKHDDDIHKLFTRS